MYKKNVEIIIFFIHKQTYKIPIVKFKSSGVSDSLGVVRSNSNSEQNHGNRRNDACWASLTARCVLCTSNNCHRVHDGSFV